MTRSSHAAEPVLLVEDKDSLRTMLRLALEGQGYAVVEARGEAEARAALTQSLPAVVLSDLRLPDGDGFGVLRAAKDADPDLPVVVMTAYGSIQDAVAAMKDGALDFLAKPVDPDHLLLMVERALAQRRMLAEYNLLKEEAAKRRGMPAIIGESPVIRQTMQSVQRAAGSDTTVLLEGESGTGKELFARALHALSARADGPLVAVNCAAIPETLLEAELFGYEKGAFTGAVQRKPGRFELAQRGTLFLDEVGELPLALQAKLLRAIETKRFERLGGTATIQVDVRLVAATNRGLRQAVASRQFREDLFFRLSVFPVTIPPLRERPEDIPLLVRHFVERTASDMGRKAPAISERAVETLGKYPWPGNVRELQNAIERAVILADGDTLHPGHLSLQQHAVSAAAPPDPWDGIDLDGSLNEVTSRVAAEAERRAIQKALKAAGGDKARAADVLQVSYKTLLARLRDFGLEK
ncbi:MAG: sigma-54-dependent Fis family transcriptional regulator [Acidobacteria bacterium]|nr:sigma-54-dependent Fis family transcriptional regulator [Acidobacteriota bacterium]